jgi:pilus assembly protein CpaF
LAATAGLGRAALHSQLAAALDAVVHLVRGLGGQRRVAEVCVLERGEDGLVTALPAVRFPAAGGQEPGPGWPRLAERCGGLRAPWSRPKGGAG